MMTVFVAVMRNFWKGGRGGGSMLMNYKSSFNESRGKQKLSIK